MNHLLAKRKSSSTLHGKQFEAASSASSSITPTSVTPSDQKPREVKSAHYIRPIYLTILATKGSFMKESDLGITDTSKSLCQTLLDAEQSVPQNTLFRDDLFKETCKSLEGRNEAMVIRDISPLICPSAQVLRIHGAKHLKLLHESVNEGWNSAKPFYGPRPQPDYSVGFGRSAFTDDQLKKLKPFVGEQEDIYTSHFMATWQIYFPFLTLEVKCGAAALDVADRQNAHSMTLAVRGIVELFRLANREKELHREILAFSISHDDRYVRIYGHYPIIDESKTTFYRYPIHEFSFRALDGKEKWTAHKFTKNVYDIWMPTHLKRICSVIDDLPSDLLNFQISQQSEWGESVPSQGSRSESRNLFEQIDYDAMSLREADDYITPDTLLSQDLLSQEIEEGVSKKTKKRGRQ